MSEPFTKIIPIEELTDGNEISFRQPRHKYNKVKIKELAESIVTKGLINPLQVWETTVAGKTYKVRIGGGRRVAAIKYLIEEDRINEGRAAGLDKGVPCHIIDEKEARQAFAAAVVDNIQREDMTAFEQAEAVWHLALDGMKGVEIASAVSRSPAWVSRMMAAYKEATAEVRDAWREDKITFENVCDLIKSSDTPEAMNKAVEKLVVKRSSGTKADKSEARAGAKTGNKPPKVERPTASQLKMYHIRSDGPHPAKYKYGQGVHDGIGIALGIIGIGDLEEDYAEFLRWKDAKEKQTVAVKAATVTDEVAKA